MRITIDTAHDSPENIKNAIKMLQSIIGERIVGIVSNSEDIIAKKQADIFEGAESKVVTDIFGTLNQLSGQQAVEQSGMLQPEGLSGKTETDEQITKEQIADDDLFADLFTKDELEKMGKKTNPKGDKSYSIELY